MIDGRRVRFAFAIKAQAQAKADEMKLAHRQHGDSILTDSVINHPDVAAALELLRPYQATFGMLNDNFGTLGFLIIGVKDARPARSH